MKTTWRPCRNSNSVASFSPRLSGIAEIVDWRRTHILYHTMPAHYYCLYAHYATSQTRPVAGDSRRRQSEFWRRLNERYSFLFILVRFFSSFAPSVFKQSHESRESARTGICRGRHKSASSHETGSSWSGLGLGGPGILRTGFDEPVAVDHVRLYRFEFENRHNGPASRQSITDDDCDDDFDDGPGLPKTVAARARPAFEIVTPPLLSRSWPEI